MDNISCGNGNRNFQHERTPNIFTNQQSYHLTINLLLCWNMWGDVERTVVSFKLLSLPVFPHPITHLRSLNSAKTFSNV